MLTMGEYRQLAAEVKVLQDRAGVAGPMTVDWSRYGVATNYLYEGEIVPKERPRQGKGGRMFTPPRTRAFEKLVTDWGKEQGMVPVMFPVATTLVFYDATPSTELVQHSRAGVTFKMLKDLDNMEKGVMDALNKVAFMDDKQIVNTHRRRRYRTTAGFRLSIARAGLSKSEYTQFLKFM